MINPYRRRRRATGIQPREKVRLWMLAGISVVILASFLGIKLIGGKGGGKGAEDGGSTGLRPAEQRDADGNLLMQAVLPSYEAVRDRLEERMRERLEEFQAAGKLGDGEEEDETEVLEYLVEAGARRARVAAMPANRYRTLDVARSKVAFEPGPFRGRLTSAWGEIIEILSPRPFPDLVEGVEELTGVRFRTDEGQLYEILTPSEFRWKKGDWIQVYGIFYRHRKVEVEGETETAFCLVHVTEQEITRAFPPVVVEKIDPAWASEIREGTYGEAHNIDERPFWLLMNYVLHLGVEGYEDLRESEDFEITIYPQSALPLEQQPQVHRFRFVGALGRIVSTRWEYSSSDNPGKIERVDSAFLWQPGEYPVFLLSPRRWSEYGLDPERMEEEFVRVEGIFYKRYMYVPRTGGPAYAVPLVIVTGIYPEGAEPGSILKYFSYGLVALAVAVVVIFFLLSFKDRRKYDEFRRDYVAKRRARREEMMQESTSSQEAPPEDDSPG